VSGIVFFATERRDAVVDFYVDRVGTDVWLEQPGCTICSYGTFRVGFCDGDATDDCGTVTFVFDSAAGVDAAYDRLADVADDPPRDNDEYDIYQFFATDPDGRTVEFQSFRHETPPLDGD
jgi:hypothetical protein